MPSNQFDFEATSIDPLKRKIKSTSQTTIVSEFINNGPDVIDIGDIHVHVTVNGRFARKPISFNSKAWELQGPILTQNGNYEIFFENKIAMVKGDKSQARFTVKAKAKGKVDITLASTVAPTQSDSDINGTNGSVVTELIIT